VDINVRSQSYNHNRSSITSTTSSTRFSSLCVPCLFMLIGEAIERIKIHRTPRSVGMSLDGRADLWAQANTRGPRFSKPMLAFLLANFPALEGASKGADFAVVGRDAPAFPIFDEPGNPPRSICARCAGSCSDLWLNLQGSCNLRRELRRIAAFRTILILDVVLRCESLRQLSRSLDQHDRRRLPDQPLLFGGFIAADAWMSRRPTSLQRICSNVLELFKSRDEITDNEKWQQELSRPQMTARSRSTNTN